MFGSSGYYKIDKSTGVSIGSEYRMSSATVYTGELAINDTTMLNIMEEAGEMAFPGHGNRKETDEARIRELERENEILRQERDILLNFVF